jgi:protein ImuB
MGLQTLGDLRSVPRAGLARRFGEGLLNELDRALGVEPDPRVSIVLPPAFESRLELFARADTTEQVLHGASLLLARLVLWLGAQHAFVRRFTLVMLHEPRRSSGGREVPGRTVLELALAEPSRDSAHLLVLLRERLARLQLPAPTLDLCLRADDITRRAAPNQELFPTARSEREGHHPADRAPAGAPRCRAGPAPAAGRRSPARMRQPDRAGERCGVVRRSEQGGFVVDATGAARRGVRRRRPQAPRQAARRAAAPVPARRSTPRTGLAAAATPSRCPNASRARCSAASRCKLLSGPERIEAGWWDTALAERTTSSRRRRMGRWSGFYRARLPAFSRRGRAGVVSCKGDSGDFWFPTKGVAGSRPGGRVTFICWPK